MIKDGDFFVFLISRYFSVYFMGLVLIFYDYLGNDKVYLRFDVLILSLIFGLKDFFGKNWSNSFMFYSFKSWKGNF